MIRIPFIKHHNVIPEALAAIALRHPAKRAVRNPLLQRRKWRTLRSSLMTFFEEITDIFFCYTGRRCATENSGMTIEGHVLGPLFVSSSSVVLLITTLTFSSYAQPVTVPVEYTLNEIITIATQQSLATQQVQTRQKNRYWQWRTYLADYRPQVYLEGTFPDFSRTNEPITQPDGTIAFRPVANNFATLNLFATQALGQYGTELFLNSQLQRFDNFEGDNIPTSYSGNPILVGIRQPLFQFNLLKWNRLIEPLRYEESQRIYQQELEEVAVQTTNYFFQTLLAQINLDIAQKNYANNDTIYQIGQKRFYLGKLPEDELLQLELNLLNAEQAIEQATREKQVALLQLRAYVGLTDSAQVKLIPPTDLPETVVDPTIALQKAFSNRAENITYRRRQQEVERDVAQARGETGFRLDLFATYGLTNRAGNLAGVYQNPDNQQQVQVSFRVPILNWGRAESRIKTAEANQELEAYTIAQERQVFEQQVYNEVSNFNTLRKQVRITQVADQVAERRFAIAKNRYVIGKNDVISLNLALTEKDRARRQYVEALQNFWIAYYTLRALTLHDFENDRTLLTPVEQPQ